MTLHRRLFLKLAGIAGTINAFGIGTPAIVRAATPIKLTLPWLPLGTYSFTFVAKKLGYWEKRGLSPSTAASARPRSASPLTRVNTISA